jgi:hypothetical protein
MTKCTFTNSDKETPIRLEISAISADTEVTNSKPFITNAFETGGVYYATVTKNGDSKKVL